MNDTKTNSLNIAFAYVIAGLSSGIIVALFILIAEITIVKWRASIIKTHFLF